MISGQRQDDPQTIWDAIVKYFVSVLRDLGLIALGAALALAAVYFGTQAKEPVITEPDCGSCKRGENTK
ncbi:hypothetical protein UFOVP669_29 [uncultured Caudovirales phage]|uniref:Uncharacterized protein n=1 Tax=uncultured Caudovirales phage TaxID=2100421 RepID=A0A6J5NF72_9CAUD|nr:hypothetical protein UFOVP400_20 [uncultured Caudovirales phage]CAB4155825.1 hypothetical protein UFOVP669_29 [uncultured Caudovirales phage]CAB4213528.1 hypothetical protein UFOVP1449_42 [uncultured Caudovirales phage]